MELGRGQQVLAVVVALHHLQVDRVARPPRRLLRQVDDAQAPPDLALERAHQPWRAAVETLQRVLAV